MNPKTPSTKVLRFAAKTIESWTLLDSDYAIRSRIQTARWLRDIAKIHKQTERAEKEFKKCCRELKGKK